MADQTKKPEQDKGKFPKPTSLAYMSHYMQKRRKKRKEEED